jgi:hypothetical protein
MDPRTRRTVTLVVLAVSIALVAVAALLQR